MSGAGDDLGETVTISAAELHGLRKAAADYELFVASYPDLYFRLDSSGHILDYRARVDELYLSPEHFLGRTMHEVLPPEVGRLFQGAMEQLSRERRTVAVEYALPIGSGIEHYEARCVPTGEGHLAIFVRNISDIWRARAQREESLSLLRATLESTADAILVVDRAGGMVDWNQRFVDLWRIPASILAERDDPRAIAAVLDQLVDADAFVARVRDLYAHPEAEGHDVFRLKDGRIFERYSRPQHQASEIIGRVWSFRDVTERERAATERDHLLAQTQEAVRIRDEFLSIASHELRTPLTALQLALHLLQRQGTGGAPPPEQLKAALETAVRQGRQLAHLVDDLLSVARIRAGRLEMRPAEMDLAALVREVASAHAESSARAGCALSAQAPESLVVRGDRARLDQVISNLLTNAIRYAAGTPIELTLLAAEGRALLRVQDRGMGIAEADQRRIFERFERGASARHYGGLGLGLYIVRQIVEAHGGAVSLESAPGAGATFTVDLPWAPA